MGEIKTKLCTEGVINESQEERDRKEDLVLQALQERTYNPLKETE